MRALLLTADGMGIGSVPTPRPGPGQALVEVAAAGLCYSDVTLANRPAVSHRFSLPLVLGHELAGTVVELGPGTVGAQVGDEVVAYGPRGCGRCRACAAGALNYCRRRPGTEFPIGLGRDGALAEFVVVPADSLIPAGGLEPAQAAALTDAGLTALHAVRRALPQGHGTSIVIGVGGLGHLAVQILSSMGPVIAVDVDPRKLELATRLGASQTVLATDDVRGSVAELSDGEGMDAVFDFVANDQTLRLAADVVGAGGALSIVGVGSARLPVGMHAVPLGTRVETPFWGTRPELYEVLEMARQGLLSVEVETVSLEAAVQGYRRLSDGHVLGRLVAEPASSEVHS